MPYLDEYEDAYQNAPDSDELPDGTYNTVITGAKLKESGPNSKYPGTPYLAWELTIIGPTYIGRKIFHNRSFSQDPERIKWLKIELSKSGLHGLQSLSDLPERLDEVLDTGMIVKQVTKGEYTNVNFVKSFDPDEYIAPEDDALEFP